LVENLVILHSPSNRSEKEALNKSRTPFFRQYDGSSDGPFAAACRHKTLDFVISRLPPRDYLPFSV
jgi:hypothetical protein